MYYKGRKWKNKITKCKECNTQIPKKEEEEVQIQIQTDWDVRTGRGFTYCVRDVQEVSLFKVQLFWLQNQKIRQCVTFHLLPPPQSSPFFSPVHHQLKQSQPLNFNVVQPQIVAEDKKKRISDKVWWLRKFYFHLHFSGFI